MFRNALRSAVLALFLVAIIPSLYAQEAAKEEKAPTIKEMQQWAKKAPEVSKEVREAISRAEDKLDEDLAAVAKEILRRVERTVKLTPGDRKALDKAHQKVDKALGEQKAKVEEEINRKFEAEQRSKEAQKEATKLLSAYRREMLVEEALKRKQAEQFAKEAWNLLYLEQNPKEAREWARRALELDPENKEARDITTAAELEMGVSSARVKWIYEKEPLLPGIRRWQALQELENAKAKARQLHTEGKFEEALGQWRKARTYVETLAPYMDVKLQRKEVMQNLQATQEAYEQAQKKLAAEREREKKEVVQQRVKDAMEMKVQQEAKFIEDVNSLIRQKRWDEAEKVLKEMIYKEPEVELPRILQKDVGRAAHKDRMSDLNWMREKQEMKVIEDSYEKLIPYSEKINFPDMKFWKEVAERRSPVAYPSKELPLTKEEKAIYEKLATFPITVAFDETPLTQVVDFLREVSGVNFTLIQQDVPADGAPITLHIETTLGQALDEICALVSGFGWKVKGPVVKIGNAERLKEYELRVYDIRDLLYNVEDKYSGQGYGGGGRGYEGRGGVTGGFEETAGGGTYPQFRSNADEKGKTEGWVAGQWGGEESWGGGSTGYGGGYGGYGGGYGAGGYGETYEEALRDRAESLAYLIATTVAPTTWVAVGGIGGAEESGYGGRSYGYGGGGYGRGGGGFGGYTYGGYGAAGAEGGVFGGTVGVPGGMPGAGAGGAELWGAPGAPGLAAPAATAATQPKGRIFFRGGNPGDLLVLQTPEVHDEIEELLKTLRKAAHIQVAVEARFLSVSGDFLQEVGFNWDAFSAQREAFQGPGLTQTNWSNIYSPSFAGAVPTITTDGDLVLTAGSASPGVPFIGTGIPFFEPGSGLNLNFSIFDEWSLTGFFRAVQSHKGNEILSAPNITLTNAQRGYLTIDTTWNYISTYSVEEGIPVPETDEVEDTISLEVRPVVSADRRYVFLELLPYTSRVLGFDTYPFETAVAAAGGDGGGAVTTISNFLQLPKTVVQTLETTVCVPDKGILMIGGLADSSRITREQGVPVLNKIPLLKRLFTAEGMQVKRSHLLILVRPEIIILREREAQAF